MARRIKSILKEYVHEDDAKISENKNISKDATMLKIIPELFHPL